MRELTLTRGLVALIDDEDFELVGNVKWFAHRTGYVIRNAPHPQKNGKRIHLCIHRVIMGLEFGDKREVDHINGDKLDNRRENLRICSRNENEWNKYKTRRNTSGFKGVSWCTAKGKWLAQVERNRKTLYLGYFESPEKAHEAYCRTVKELNGEFANFGERMVA